MNYSDTTIVIPTLNEEKNIGRLVDFLHSRYPQIKVVVADDGSRDKTQAIAQNQGAVVLDRTYNKIKGISAAVVHALKLVQTENLIVIDADFQHPPEKIKEIVEKLDYKDIVIGTRSSVPKDWGFVRKLQSDLANFLANLRLNRKVKDPMSGFFGVKTGLFRRTYKKNFELKCFKILFNILKNNRKPKIGYVYYDFNLRQGGQSKISKKHIYYFLRNVFS
jgi:dolichol-phosphate mannosyltransferase